MALGTAREPQPASHSLWSNTGAPFSPMPVRDWDKLRRQSRAHQPARPNPVAAASARRRARNKARKTKRRLLRSLYPHRYRQGGYSAPGMQNSPEMKKNNMRNTNPAIHEQAAGERVAGRVTARPLTGGVERGILYRTQRLAFEPLVPTAVGPRQQAHPPCPQSQRSQSLREY